MSPEDPVVTPNRRERRGNALIRRSGCWPCTYCPPRGGGDKLSSSWAFGLQTHLDFVDLRDHAHANYTVMCGTGQEYHDVPRARL